MPMIRGLSNEALISDLKGPEFSFPTEAEVERGVEYGKGVEREVRAVEADVVAISTCAIGTEIVTRRATARIVVRQPRIAEQTLSELDLQWINWWRLGNRGDRLFGRGAVGIKQLIR